MRRTEAINLKSNWNFLNLDFLPIFPGPGLEQKREEVGKVAARQYLFQKCPSFSSNSELRVNRAKLQVPA